MSQAFSIRLDNGETFSVSNLGSYTQTNVGTQTINGLSGTLMQYYLSGTLVAQVHVVPDPTP